MIKTDHVVSELFLKKTLENRIILTTECITAKHIAVQPHCESESNIIQPKPATASKIPRSLQSSIDFSDM